MMGNKIQPSSPDLLFLLKVFFYSTSLLEMTKKKKNS